MSDEFGPIVMHDGKGCPVPIGTVIRVTVELEPDHLVTVVETVQMAGAAWFWENWLQPLKCGDLCGRVLAYSVKRPDALDGLRAIAAAPDAPLPVPTRPAPVLA